MAWLPTYYLIWQRDSTRGNGMAPSSDSAQGSCSQEGVVGTMLCQAELLSKPGMNIHEGPHPCTNKGGTEVKHPRAADIWHTKRFQEFLLVARKISKPFLVRKAHWHSRSRDMTSMAFSCSPFFQGSAWRGNLHKSSITLFIIIVF